MNSTLLIRQETDEDHVVVESLIKKAFENDPIGDHTEHLMVNRLRKSDAFIPELSLVAESEGIIRGHILVTKILVKNDNESFSSLALAPVSVHPDYQGKGIGAKLIRKAHKVAVCLGHHSIVLLGHKNYYPRFGYETASKFGIRLPFDVPDEYCMAIELVKGGLGGVSGTVEYPQEFFQ